MSEKPRISLDATQTLAVLRALKAAREGAGQASYILAAAKLGDLALWRRMDALEQEMAELLAGLQPTLFLE